MPDRDATLALLREYLSAVRRIKTAVSVQLAACDVWARFMRSGCNGDFDAQRRAHDALLATQAETADAKLELQAVLERRRRA